jgi:hypothetical protein
MDPKKGTGTLISPARTKGGTGTFNRCAREGVLGEAARGTMATQRPGDPRHWSNGRMGTHPGLPGQLALGQLDHEWGGNRVGKLTTPSHPSLVDKKVLVGEGRSGLHFRATGLRCGKAQSDKPREPRPSSTQVHPVCSTLRRTAGHGGWTPPSICDCLGVPPGADDSLP